MMIPACDIVCLRDAIEAQHGRHFTGILGWELSQLIGVAEVRSDYDSAKLPPPVQATLYSAHPSLRS